MTITGRVSIQGVRSLLVDGIIFPRFGTRESDSLDTNSRKDGIHLQYESSGSKFRLLQIDLFAFNSGSINVIDEIVKR